MTKERSKQCGLTLIETVFTVAIIGLSSLALSGLLFTIIVTGRNLPRRDLSTPGQAQTYQQAVEQINIFLLELSRDAREAKRLEARNGSLCPNPKCSECLLIHRDEGAFIIYEYWENEGVVKREGKTMIKGVLRENSPIFQVVNDSSVIVTLPVRYLPQNPKAVVPETRVFSFTVERRLSPLSSPSS